MRTALVLSAFALVTVLGARAPASVPVLPRAELAPTTQLDPEPTDCPFCGGNAALHIQRMFGLERMTLGLSTSLLR